MVEKGRGGGGEEKGEREDGGGTVCEGEEGEENSEYEEHSTITQMPQSLVTADKNKEVKWLYKKIA